MTLLGRIFVILFALVMAVVASAIVTAIALVIMELRLLGSDPLEHAFFWAIAAFGTGVAIVAGFLPTLIGVVLAEAFSVRSVLAYAAAGAVITLLGNYGAGFAWTYDEPIDRTPPPISREGEIAVAAGVVFGCTYWLIAGRRAGAWRKQS